jgi:alcohol dehydrogenase class IV
MAGQAFSNASVGLAHSLGEPMGSYHHVGHGLACALYLPAVMAFNLPAEPEKFADIAEALGVQTTEMDTQQAAEASVDAVRQLFTDIKLPLTFAEAGIDFKLEAQMIEDVWPQYSTRCNPRSPSPEEVEALYKTPGS